MSVNLLTYREYMGGFSEVDQALSDTIERVTNPRGVRKFVRLLEDFNTNSDYVSLEGAEVLDAILVEMLTYARENEPQHEPQIGGSDKF